nr:MAG TPA: hypothetical protein [Caudoviricetes sp.]
MHHDAIHSLVFPFHFSNRIEAFPRRQSTRRLG